MDIEQRLNELVPHDTDPPRRLVLRQAMITSYRLGLEAGKAQEGALADVSAERKRQMEREGWSPEHDDMHANGDIGLAGAVYAMHTAMMFQGCAKDDVPTPWPFEKRWWKPKDPRRNLVRAAALIVAEIERIDRARAIEQEDVPSPL